MAGERKYPSIIKMPTDLLAEDPAEVFPQASFPTGSIEESHTMPIPIKEIETPRGETDKLFAFQELASQLLVRRHYTNSKTAYPICEEYLNRLRAISKIADIPISNVINNIFYFFFDSQGVLNPTNTAIKKMFLADRNDTLKEYLGSTRPTSKKE